MIKETEPEKFHTYGYEGKKWVCYYHFIGWENLSLGFSINFALPNIEIHLPGGFVRVGVKPGWQFYKEWTLHES